MIKSTTINIGYQAKKDNAGGNGLIGNINVQTPVSYTHLTLPTT